ncbi:MAG: hypothetical protein ACK5B9_03235 [Flavobacteriia bacterium]
MKLFNTFKNQSKILLNIDWLTLSCTDIFNSLTFDKDDIYELENFVIHEQKKGKTQLFNRKAFVYYYGQKISTITFQSSSNIQLVNRAHIKIENELFYDNQGKAIINQFINTFRLTAISVSRLDICVDGVFLHNFFNSYFYEKNAIIHRVKGTHDDFNHPYSSASQRRSFTYDCYSFGSYGNRSTGTSKSSKFARYYNKSKEIKEQSHKTYILDYWKNNGFNIEKDIYRFEFELKNNYLKTIKDFSFEKIFDFEYLKMLFNTATKNTLEFRLNDGTKNVTRYEPINLFEGLSSPILERVKRVIKSVTRTTKILIKKLYFDCIAGAYKNEGWKRISFIENMNSLIVDNNLVTWWKQSKDRFNDDLHKLSRTNNIELNYKHLDTYAI